MDSKFIFTILAVGMALCIAPATRAQTRFSEVRTTLEKWVETRQLISKEKAEWSVQKESLQQQIDLLEKEEKLLTEQIAKAEATTTEADKERHALLEENEALSAAGTAVRTVIAQLEKRVLDLSKSFPPPLMDRIEPLYKRIPQNPATARLSVSERMQNVIGILSEVDKFNNNITLVSELKKNPAGVDVQVQTMYLGLGAGFYVDKSMSFAGVGAPTLEGWEWTPRPDLASRIAKAIFVYENASAAVFVNLPVTIK